MKVDGGEVVFEDAIVGGIGKGEVAEVAFMGFGPVGLAVVVVAESAQESEEPGLGAVGRFLMQYEEEWLVLRAGLKKLNPEITGNIGAVPFDGHFLGRREKGGIPLGSLPGKDDPATRPFWVTSKLPLSNHPGVIASGLQVFDHVITLGIKAVKNRDPIEV